MVIRSAFSALILLACSANALTAQSQAVGNDPYEKIFQGPTDRDDGIAATFYVVTRNRVFIALPASLFDVDLLLTATITQGVPEAAGIGEPVAQIPVRFQLATGNRVLLRRRSFTVMTTSMAQLAAVNNDAILAAFNVEAAHEGSVLVDMTSVFSGDVAELRAFGPINGVSHDRTRSFIERVRSFPTAIDVEVSQTYGLPETNRTFDLAQGRRNTKTITIVLHFSLIRLPEKPMAKRIFDSRVGYNSVAAFDFSDPTTPGSECRYIHRWRLEVEKVSATASRVVRPIVFWIDRSVPEEWRPFVRSGVLSWLPAFEAAGFPGAIEIRDAPTDDVTWSPDDFAHSIIRWVPSKLEDAYGTVITDPRTGEILRAEIQLHQNILRLLQRTYITQVGVLDKRVQAIPLPHDVLGRLLAYVTAHEAGHIFGLLHNFHASSLYPPEKLRDSRWLAKMGHSPSVMDYSRFNYVAQPTDNVDPTMLIPQIGPYDRWAILWGYRPIANVRTPADERSTLEEWLSTFADSPWLRYFPRNNISNADPGSLTDAVGDADVLFSVPLGLKNLERTIDLLPALVAASLDRTLDITTLYESVLSQRFAYLRHVLALVGGVEQKAIVASNVRIVPVDATRQRQAVEFIGSAAFAIPEFLTAKRLDPDTDIVQLKKAYLGFALTLIENMLDDARFNRIAEYEALAANAYQLSDYLNDVRNSLWDGISSHDPIGDSLQHQYVRVLGMKLNRKESLASLVSAVIRNHLRQLRTDLRRSVMTAGSRSQQERLEQTIVTLDEVLTDKGAADGGPSTSLR